MSHQWIITLTLLSSAAFAFPSADYRTNFDPSQLKASATGMPSQVVVLGTPHLRTMPDGFDPDTLQPLLNRLQHWAPQIITIEALSGTQCDMMRRNPTRYGATISRYCWNTVTAQQATGLDVPEATVQVNRLLRDWPANPDASQRRQLAVLFLAAGDQASALVQWLRLPPDERIADQALTAPLAQHLRKLGERHDESYLVAARLAAQLGLERVIPIDDHTADSDDDPADQATMADTMQRIWDNPATRQRTAMDQKLRANLHNGDGVLQMYRVLNAPDQAQLIYDSDFGAALRDQSPQLIGRNYVGYWETRNLRMVSNIRSVIGDSPGRRTLSIVGASHKWYVESYLAMMHDVQLVDAEQVLQ